MKVQKSFVDTNEEIKVSVKVKNTGQLYGEEVVQLYVGCDSNEVERFKKELKGFKRVQLNPEEEKEVTFTFKPTDLAYYSPESKSWITELCDYNIYVGSSSASKDLLHGTVRVTE